MKRLLADLKVRRNRSRTLFLVLTIFRYGVNHIATFRPKVFTTTISRINGGGRWDVLLFDGTTLIKKLAKFVAQETNSDYDKRFHSKNDQKAGPRS